MPSNSTRFHRSLFPTLLSRLAEERRFVQVLLGPRQVGKTTLARQVADDLEMPVHFVTADEPTLKGSGWLATEWQTARSLCTIEGETTQPALLVVDEVQKLDGWSETVKRLWDQDTADGTPLRLLLLGSSPMLVSTGLTESLAGRFEILRADHWSYAEMRVAFGWDLDEYIYFGGYPGAAALVEDEGRWRRYVLDSLIETTISRDILLTTTVGKPALLRRLFGLVCEYSGRELSYTKMLGQLQDAGNTTTLAGYLDLLEGVGMAVGLQKFAGEKVRRRASSPKLLVRNTGLMSALDSASFAEAQADRKEWGRRVESAVGAALAVATAATDASLYYWREGGAEVDFVVESGSTLTAIEVKSGTSTDEHRGLDAFVTAWPTARPVLVGSGGIPLAQFLVDPVGVLGL